MSSKSSNDLIEMLIILILVVVVAGIAIVALHTSYREMTTRYSCLNYGYPDSQYDAWSGTSYCIRVENGTTVTRNLKELQAAK